MVEFNSLLLVYYIIVCIVEFTSLLYDTILCHSMLYYIILIGWTRDATSAGPSPSRRTWRASRATPDIIEYHVYICVYIYMSMCVYIYIYIHTHIRIYIYIYICTCTCICICMCIYIYIYIVYDSE